LLDIIASLTFQSENVALKDEVNVLQKELTAMEEEYNDQLQRTIHETELSHADELSREHR